MTLEEIQDSAAAERRARGLKANAKRAAETARQLQVKADAGAERLQLQQSREKQSQQHRKNVGTTIKPHK